MNSSDSRPNAMRSFLTVWGGQTASRIGSTMTNFAVILWVFEQTGQATSLTLIGLAHVIANFAISLVAGAVVDRFSRKSLILIGDSASACSTVVLLLLFTLGHLEVWHLYVAVMANTIFSTVQGLAYSASISLMIPKRHYARSGGLSTLTHYSSVIIGDATAGALYASIGLLGIMWIDLVTFGIAMATVVWVRIPQPVEKDDDSLTLMKQLTLGFRYVGQRKPLLALFVVQGLFIAFHDFVNAIQYPMLLARTNNNALVVAGVSVAAGLAGILSSVVVSVRSGPKRHIHSVLMCYIGAGISKSLFGLANAPFLWYGTQFISSLHFPPLVSSRSAILMSKVDPHVQGRVFAVMSMVVFGVSAAAHAIAGPLADQVFEPAMQPGGVLATSLGEWFGTGPGAGLAVLHAFVALGMVAVGVLGFAWPALRNIEERLKDHNQTTP